jgi:prophage regulatory protein
MKPLIASVSDAGAFMQRCKHPSLNPVQAEGGKVLSLPTGPIRILRLGQVLALTGLRKTTIYALQSKGRFPMRVQITQHSVGWVEGDVQRWLAVRVAESTAIVRDMPNPSRSDRATRQQ